MTTKQETQPKLVIVPNTETIASCSACGEDNYRRAKRDDSHRAVFIERPGVKLWDVRISPNDYQTVVVKLCQKCLAVLHGATGEIVVEPLTVAEQRLDQAILSLAQGVSNDLTEIVGALRRDRRDELADDLTKLHDAWRDASQAAFDSFNTTRRIP